MDGSERTDQIFEALAAVQRRRLLFALTDHNPQQIDEMSGVPWSLSESEAEMTTNHHVHLPKLADYGFVDWDRNEQVITKGPRFDEIEPLLECLEDNRDELPIEPL